MARTVRLRRQPLNSAPLTALPFTSNRPHTTRKHRNPLYNAVHMNDFKALA